MFDFPLPAGLANALRSPGTRRFLALAVLATLALTTWFLYRWATTPNLVPLFEQSLGLGEAQEYESQLQADGVRYRVTNGGANILVPSNQLARLKVEFAAQSQGLSGCGAPTTFSIGSGSLEQQIERTRSIREHLNCTIARMDGVQQAQVNVTLQENSPFVNMRRGAKASVTVWPSRGRTVTEEMVESIAFIVASAVDGLEPERVAVINGVGGYSLQSPADGATSGAKSNRELSVQRGIEIALREKTERLLHPLMTAGEFQVQVSAELDWTEVERRSERFDPEAQAIIREEAAEVPPGAAGPGSPSYTTEQRESQYSVTVENMTVAPGSIARLGVAVAVNENAPLFGDSLDPAREVIRAQQIARIDSLVRAAVGFDEARGDVVTVTAFPFQVVAEADFATAGSSIESPLLWAEMLMRPLIGLLGILLLAFVGMKLLKSPALAKPPAPAELPASTPAAESLPGAPPMQAMAPQMAPAGSLAGGGPVSEDPEAAARVVKAWLQEV